MTTPIGSSTSNAAVLQATRSRATADSVATQDEQNESTTLGVQVSFSDMLRDRLKAARQVGSALRARMAQVQEARKEAARQRIEEIRERIRMLKMLAVGGLASKGTLREIQQLARELGQAASVLKESSAASMTSGSVSSGTEADPGATDAVATDGAETNLSSEQAADADSDSGAEPQADTETVATATAKPAETDEASETNDADVDDAVREAFAAVQSNRSDDGRQRRADGEAVQKALRELKGLLAMVRATAQVGDKESKRLIEDIQKQMADIEDMAGEMSGFGTLSIGSISINV